MFWATKEKQWHFKIIPLSYQIFLQGASEGLPLHIDIPNKQIYSPDN